MTAGTRLAEQLDVLQARRQGAQASLADTDGPGDRADQAEALELADELARIDDRIAEIMRELHHPASDPLLSPGTRVQLRSPDGSEEDLHLGDAAEAESVGGDLVLTADSLLGMALIRRHSGDRISYSTPDGTQIAAVLTVWPPTDDRAPAMS